MTNPPGAVVVVIPTYEEADTLPETVSRLRAAVPEATVLVVDDASPDGTGAVAERLAAADPAVHVLHRGGKEGLGVAYRSGFAWARSAGYDVIVEMDADGSHQPEELPKLLAALRDDVGLVIGSRWVPGGAVRNWPWYRRLLSRGANTYTRFALGLPVRDATAGFRAFRAAALDLVDLDRVESQGYCFQIDMAWRLYRSSVPIREVPITFVERVAGHSKMSRQIVLEALFQVTRWGLRRLRPGRRRR